MERSGKPVGDAVSPEHAGRSAHQGVEGQDVCPRCGGSGRVEGGTCDRCNGTGVVVEPVGGG